MAQTVRAFPSANVTALPAPDRKHILAAMAAVLPEISANAAATEAARRVPDRNVALLRAAGLFRIVQPARCGGWELDFDLLAEAIQEIGTACASTAWACGLQAAHQWLLASFPIEAQHDVWDSNPDALLCGSYAPAVRALHQIELSQMPPNIFERNVAYHEQAPALSESGLRQPGDVRVLRDRHEPRR